LASMKDSQCTAGPQVGTVDVTERWHAGTEERLKAATR
jgi:hypothetical protein